LGIITEIQQTNSHHDASYITQFIPEMGDVILQ